MDDICRQILRRGPIGLSKVQGKGSLGVLDCIARNSQYVPYSVSSNLHMIASYDAGASYLDALACDIHRVLMSCVQTILSIEKPSAMPKSSAWLCIQLYYASFFAGNALCRMANNGVYYVDPLSASDIRNNFQAVGIPPNLSSGSYTFNLNASTGHISMSGPVSSKGTHAAVWSCYLGCLDEILSASVDPVGAESEKWLISLRNSITRNGRDAGNWLSTMRNDINYRGLHGVWSPKSKSLNFQRLMEIFWAEVRTKSQTEFTADQSIGNFVRAAASVIKICLSYAAFLHDIAPTKSVFRGGKLHALIRQIM